MIIRISFAKIHWRHYMNNCPKKEELLAVFKKCKNIQEVASQYKVSWSTVRCWLRWLKIDFKPSKEVLLIDCDKLTDLEMASKYKVSDRTIAKWKLQFNISKKNIKINKLPFRLSGIQNDLITGKLLGDSHLEKIRNINSHFCVEQCEKSKEYVEAVHEILYPFSLPIRYRNRINVFKKKSHHVDRIYSCLFNTVYHPIFTNLRNKWYPQGIKIVPKDINLSWRAIAFWFCDDGYNGLGKRCIRHHGVLCTNSFSEEEVEFLISKLSEKGIKCNIYFDKKQPMIHLHGDTFEFFIDHIKPFVPWECMQYKLMY